MSTIYTGNVLAPLHAARHAGAASVNRIRRTDTVLPVPSLGQEVLPDPPRLRGYGISRTYMLCVPDTSGAVDARLLAELSPEEVLDLVLAAQRWAADLESLAAQRELTASVATARYRAEHEAAIAHLEAMAELARLRARVAELESESDSD